MIKRGTDVTKMSTVKRQRRLAVLCAAIMMAVLATSPQAADIKQPFRLVDSHTAGVLAKGHIDTELRVYAAPQWSVDGSGLIIGTHVGITDRFAIGLSYGGEGLIGYGSRVEWYRYPGAVVKYCFFEEKFATPGLTVGLDNQGYGGLADSAGFGYRGYVYKSPGVFAAVSKSFLIFNTVQVGFHTAANYSFEDMDNVKWPNYMLGIDIGISDEFALVAEYNLAVDDITGSKDSYGNPFYGFLNIGLRWAFTENFHLEFDARDILESKTRIVNRVFENGEWVDVRRPVGWSRELKVVYITKF